MKGIRETVKHSDTEREKEKETVIEREEQIKIEG